MGHVEPWSQEVLTMFVIALLNENTIKPINVAIPKTTNPTIRFFIV